MRQLGLDLETERAGQMIFLWLPQGEASIFHVAMGRTTSSSRSLTIEQVTAISGLDTCKEYRGKATKTKLARFLLLI